MDITKSAKKLYTTRLINGETVNYTVVFSAVSLLLLVLKQAFKLIFGVGAGVSTAISAVICAIVLFFGEKKFVFNKNSHRIGATQIIAYIFRCAVDFGFYKIMDFLFCSTLHRPKAFVFFGAYLVYLFFNYYFDKLLVFDSRANAKSNMNGRCYKTFFYNRFVVFSLLLSAVCIAFVYFIFRLFPFGDMTVMRMDLYHQYGPLFAELYDRVIEHKSFIYSWQSGGGSSFLGNYFNYLSSPLSAIIFLFDRKDISYAITTLVLVKGCLSAGTFAYYLKSSLGRHSYLSASFGVFYSLCGYFLAYYWNIMWLDGMILLPIIVLGIEKIIDGKKPLTYIASLTLLLFSSYYMGYMVCIFSVVYFFVYYISNHSFADKLCPTAGMKKYSIRKFLNLKFINRGLRFAGASLLSAALCACTLIPVYFILQACSATSDTFPDTFNSYFDLLDLFSSHLAALETTIRSSGDDVLPNIYCSMLTVILAPLYFVNKDIKLKEKAMYVLLIIFFVFSFNNNCANFVWHAFHFPNDLPYRFSFIYSFVVLIVAFKGAMKIKSLRYQDIAIVGMVWMLIIFLYQKDMTSKMSEKTIYISLAFIIVWTGFLLLVKKNKVSNVIVSTLVVAITFCEVIVSDSNSFVFTQAQKDYVAHYDNYTESIDKIKSQDKDFYRTELTYLDTRMDPCLYGYDGMSTFSSMAYEDYSQTQYSLGMFGNRINSYTYNTQTPLYNMMYALKYLTKAQSSAELSSDYYTQIFKSDDSKVKTYKNKYYLPIAFETSSDIKDWSTAEGNPFAIQEQFADLACGVSKMFVPLKYSSTDCDYIDCDDVTENGTYYFSKMDTDSDYGTVELTVEATTDSDVYIYITSPEIENVNYYFSNEANTYQNINEPYIMDLGKHKKGEKITVSLDCGSIDANESYFEIYAYSIDKNVLDSAYDFLNAGKLNVTSYSDTQIDGTIDARYNGTLYTSIPYDEGWSITIDGEEVKPIKIGNSQLACGIVQGKHTVKFKYTPKGMKYGVAISGAAWLGVIAYCLIKRFRKKNDKSSVC